jgi:hypothetical protein
LLLKAVVHGNQQTEDYREKSYRTNQKQICPQPDDWDDFVEDYPDRGMPFGFPALSANSVAKLKSWEAAGFQAPKQTDLEIVSSMPKQLQRSLRQIEDRLNGKKIEQKIVSRYLYEHLFLAHIYLTGFSEHPFRLVRSRTPYPHEVSEIATRRPYDDPKSKNVYYRFRPVRGTITHKDHILFEIDSNFLSFVEKELVSGKWVKKPKDLPPYKPEEATIVSSGIKRAKARRSSVNFAKSSGI